VILFPAVDIKNGQCVRLRQGKADEVTVFSKDPVAMALHWVSLGAKWLHIVDLDGAFSGRPVNFGLVQEICREAGIPVQLGGGIRDMQTAGSYLEAGVTRLIIGTMALEDREGFAALCAAYPGKIGVSLDAVEGRLKTRGWVGESNLTVSEVIPGIQERGASFIVYTDISRDGMHAGVNVDGLEALLGMTSLPVIAAGGVSTLKDVQSLYSLGAKGLQGVITGRAIYEGTLDLAAALEWIAHEAS
jgi:phosphoribosylformimino-5-aminoimidazole carboxamide ribotide isomerase